MSSSSRSIQRRRPLSESERLAELEEQVAALMDDRIAQQALADADSHAVPVPEGMISVEHLTDAIDGYVKPKDPLEFMFHAWLVGRRLDKDYFAKGAEHAQATHAQFVTEWNVFSKTLPSTIWARRTVRKKAKRRVSRSPGDR